MVEVTVTLGSAEVKLFLAGIEVHGTPEPEPAAQVQKRRKYSRPSVRTRILGLLAEDPETTWRADKALKALWWRGTPVVSGDPYGLVATTLARLVRGGLACRVAPGVYRASDALRATQSDTAA